jgi:phosphoenolpyruvate carboxykinase (ATP)
MSLKVISIPRDELGRLGLLNAARVHYQDGADDLIRDGLRRGEAVRSSLGPLVIRTGEFTGRSPKDRYILREAGTEAAIDWNEFNQPIEESYFERILRDMVAYLNRTPEIWVRDCFACADPIFRISIRVINETATGNLFAHNMFIQPEEDDLENFRPDWQILTAPGLKLEPSACGTRQQNAVLISFKHRMILIAGTGYTGEMKKAIFSVLNYILPLEQKVLSMHCSANRGEAGDTAIFFGLSGTGKTTLSTDPDRRLIGDDEHGWSETNIFNFEGGCYAKCINLKAVNEPEIFNAIYGEALVENVPFHKGTHDLNFQDGSITENTRVSYPLSHIHRVADPATGCPPRNIFFLTCDAYGVLPPLSRLNAGQAMYHFLSGYTAKVAGTETGIKEPKLTFSTCFGAPFLPLHPSHYARMLGRKLKDQQSRVWLVNTGWTGGPYGTGRRIELSYTRTMISAVLAGCLDQVEYQQDPIFGLAVPRSCPGLPQALLNPANTWSDREAYLQQAQDLASQFRRNFQRFRDTVSEEILAGGPII